MIKFFHSLPADQRAMVNQLPPEKKKEALSRLFMSHLTSLRRQQDQQNQQQQQMQHSAFMGNAGNVGNMNNMNNGMNNMNMGNMGNMNGMQGAQATPQMGAPMGMPGMGVSSPFAGRMGGPPVGQQMNGTAAMMNYGQPQMATNGMGGMNPVGGLPFGGMHQRMAGAGGAPGTAMPNLSANVLHSFMQRNQDGINPGM